MLLQRNGEERESAREKNVKKKKNTRDFNARYYAGCNAEENQFP